MTELSNCRLCGLPNPRLPVREGEHAFCCYGCREVFRSFGDEALAVARERIPEPAAAPQGKTAYLWIDGMHCASCEFLIEKLAIGTRGIQAATASYATSTARVVYDPGLIQESELPAIMDRFGYRARLRDADAPEYDERQDLLRVLTGGCLA
ncbi:MAG: cation transporter, partial [Burkholderiales bacterium]